MPRVKTTAPDQSRQKGQRSQQLPDFLSRFLPEWRTPEWMKADMWRGIVANQPIAAICEETLISNVLSLDWKLEPRDPTQRDELKDEIKYYTKLFENGGDGGIDYPDIIEWAMQDYLRIPFGAGMEIGREGDDPEGRVMWLEMLDGGTLFPTLNHDFPVGQKLPTDLTYTVYFPYYGIDRLYMSPRPSIYRKGWGMAPPEKIYLALELLNRGDRYYANLLLDTPEVGILDLGDMDGESAKEWIESWRTLLTGIDPFKIPVLYEHEKPATFIQFNRSPTELMFDAATMKYASIVASGYGMGLSDIGLGGGSGGGDTLAGSIRSERKTRKTGYSKAKLRLKYFFDRILPDTLEWKFIDLDDEIAVALGRARLANATAWGTLIDKRIFTPDEARKQSVADGLVSISIPEEVDEKAFDVLTKTAQNTDGKSTERPGMLGKPVSPSQGGYGEVRSLLDVAMKDPDFKSTFEELEEKWDKLDDASKQDATIELQNFLGELQRASIGLDVLSEIDDNLD